jgi:hypothetical protein
MLKNKIHNNPTHPSMGFSVVRNLSNLTAMHVRNFVGNSEIDARKFFPHSTCASTPNTHINEYKLQNTFSTDSRLRGCIHTTRVHVLTRQKPSEALNAVHSSPRIEWLDKEGMLQTEFCQRTYTTTFIYLQKNIFRKFGHFQVHNSYFSKYTEELVKISRMQ